MYLYMWVSPNPKRWQILFILTPHPKKMLSGHYFLSLSGHFYESRPCLSNGTRGTLLSGRGWKPSSLIWGHIQWEEECAAY